MTLKQFITILEAVAKRQKAVAEIIPEDVYRLDSMPAAKYGVFAWQHSAGGHGETIGEPDRALRFTLFYIDRLTEDRGNELDIQSVGIETLGNILRTIVAEDPDGVSIPGAVVYVPFLQKFTDECAGVYCDVTFNVAIDYNCEEI